MTPKEASSLVCKNFVNLCTNFPYLREAFGMLIDLGKQPRTVAEIREWVKGRIEKKQNTLDRLAHPGYEESYMIVEYEQQEFKQLLDYIDNKEAK